MALPTGRRPSIAGGAWRRVARSAGRVRSGERGLLASRERERTAALTWAPKTPTVNVYGAQGRGCDWRPRTGSGLLGHTRSGGACMTDVAPGATNVSRVPPAAPGPL